MRTEAMEDVCMNEVSDLSFDHHQLRKTSDTKKAKDLQLGTGWKRVTGSFVVANRTAINKVLYTNEDAPEPVLIHIPPIIRPNRAIGTLYFNFEITYVLEVEYRYDPIGHPQKVPLTTKAQVEAGTQVDFDYDKNLINVPNRHFHRHNPKGLAHERTVHVYKGNNKQTTTAATNSGKYINK